MVSILQSDFGVLPFPPTNHPQIPSLLYLLPNTYPSQKVIILTPKPIVPC